MKQRFFSVSRRSNIKTQTVIKQQETTCLFKDLTIKETANYIYKHRENVNLINAISENKQLKSQLIELALIEFEIAENFLSSRLAMTANPSQLFTEADIVKILDYYLDVNNPICEEKRVQLLISCSLGSHNEQLVKRQDVKPYLKFHQPLKEQDFPKTENNSSKFKNLLFKLFKIKPEDSSSDKEKKTEVAHIPKKR